MQKKHKPSDILILLLVVLVGMFSNCKREESVKLAFIGPLTGPNAAQGVGARNAFDLAVRQSNASREFPLAIEMISLDDASDPATGANAATKVVSDPEIIAAASATIIIHNSIFHFLLINKKSRDNPTYNLLHNFYINTYTDRFSCLILF